MGLVKEFREFAVKGNAVDLAVGMIIGGAFGKIVTSLVNDVVMPPIGMLLGQVDFTDLALTLKEGTPDATGAVVGAVVLSYGKFINTVLDFLIVAFVIFMAVRTMNKLRRQGEADTAAK